jgi:hypothetical protein
MGGGSRRMVQIYEMLKTVNPEVQLISPLHNDNIPKKIKKKIRKDSQRQDLFAPSRMSLSLRKWSEEHRDMVYRLRKFSAVWAGSVKELQGLDIAVMDDPIYFLPLFKKLQQLQIPVIAICHNLETLVTRQVVNKWAMDLFQEELAILRKCRLVITISREEDVLLQNFGIRTLYIPYYPVQPIMSRLCAVRESRKCSYKEGILMAGTTRNLPTRDGMERAAAYWRQNRFDKTAGKLIIGGYKSEMYFDPRPFGDSVDFRGTMTNEEMDGLLHQVRACICYQKNGAGALTRIGEMLIAGVPVLASTHAARSYYNMKGVIEFRELDELGEALKKIDKLEEEIPLPQFPDISSLYREIQRILQ